MPLDLTSTQDTIKSKLDAIKTYTEVSRSEKSLLNKIANSTTESISQTANQLNKVKDQQKRYQREVQNSMDQLLGFLSQTQGNGSATLKYLRKKILETAVKIEPHLSTILKEETIKSLGCSVEQTYNGVSSLDLSLQPLPLRPQQEGIYIPVNSLDFFSNLKQSPTTPFGKIFYEESEPSASPVFKPYGGFIPYPMNKQLYQLMDSQNSNRSFSQINGKNYLGKSGQDLFDIQYTKTNNFGVSGDYFRVILIDRESENGEGGILNKTNKVGEFITDYYSTIKLIDVVDVGAQLVNLLSGALKIQAQVGFGELENQSKFSLITSRILGLCFDDRREIDVSGIAKVGELDGIDDSFFELNEIDLRNIEIEIDNIQNGVMEFQDCDNIKLPVDYEVLVDQLIEFRNTSTGQTVETQVSTLEQIIDSISDNPDWKIYGPTSLNVKASIDNNVIKKIPLVIAASVLTPKNLLPLYTLMSVVQSGATYTYNQVVTSANTVIQSGNTIGNATSEVGKQASNVINDGLDFLKKYKVFSIQVISKINAIFLETLYEILKKDIINLVSIIISDAAKSKITKKYTIILRLVQITLVVSQLVDDYRRCKNLLDNILLLLNLVGQMVNKPGNEIPLPLLALSSFLPGTSPERTTTNAIEGLQRLGIPTGTLPDGSPNYMLLYNLISNKAIEKEEAENGKVEVVTPAGPGYGKKL